MEKQKQLVIKTINTLGRRVSAADVATKTGLPISTVFYQLNKIAEETSGRLQVSQGGDIAYSFPTGFQTAYISAGLKRVFGQASAKLFKLSYLLLRISFGIMLILSIATIVILMLVILNLRSSERDDRDESNFNFDFFDWVILRELFLSQRYYPDQTRSKANSGNFLLNCFSFLFGDGNPNFDLEQRRWQAIANTIRDSAGVITAEQVAPFTGKDPAQEDQMLSVLVHFDGRPAVSEKGNLIYLFPALQTTASSKAGEKSQVYLQASKIPFSRIDSIGMAQVIALALINFIGSWFIYFQAVNILPAIYPLLLALIIYGSLFIALPLVRYFVIQSLNSKIEGENKVRKVYSSELSHPSQKLADKLKEAQDYALNMRTISTNDLVYDSGKDLLEQSFNYS